MEPEINNQNNQKGIFQFVIEFVKTAVKVVLIVAILRIFILQPFYVRGESMEPIYHEGEYVVIEKVLYRFSNPQRGDVVVFKFPYQEECGPLTGNECLNFIKRVIGLPGERVEVREGHVFIYNNEHPNGFELKEPYLPSPDEYPTSGVDSKTLGEREFYVLGDNRLPGGSSDSRDWGVLHKSFIAGRVWIRVFPLTTAGVNLTVEYPEI